MLRAVMSIVLVVEGGASASKAGVRYSVCDPEAEGGGL